MFKEDHQVIKVFERQTVEWLKCIYPTSNYACLWLRSSRRPVMLVVCYGNDDGSSGRLSRRSRSSEWTKWMNDQNTKETWNHRNSDRIKCRYTVDLDRPSSADRQRNEIRNINHNRIYPKNGMKIFEVLEESCFLVIIWTGYSAGRSFGWSRLPGHIRSSSNKCGLTRVRCRRRKKRRLVGIGTNGIE